MRRAVALGWLGNEQHHLYVRLLAACEIVENASYYDKNSPNCIVTDDRIELADIAGVMREVLTDGSYADMLHLYAMSAVLDIRIQSYVPPTTAVGLGKLSYIISVNVLQACILTFI